MDNLEDLYPCVGICELDPDSGYCLGCGRPPLDEPQGDAAGNSPVDTPAPADHALDTPA
ncbi:DUF1289 domain-containing protein [Quatrionicoccus australiensis]|uniref:DUF1289 domain-containing protein n=1 Tax=Quatrionicoccus australiensis TaxID=138118 RepID=UPI001CFB93E0|nr:DUF1289 domain-containing protein [Quatrionicoccus australiensis]MCB4360110.1 DUF1289 domain-containing protein [Quatrionicoccus australiensis]